MCHHIDSVEEMSAADRAEMRETHDDEELRAELTAEELEQLGLTA